MPPSSTKLLKVWEITLNSSKMNLSTRLVPSSKHIQQPSTSYPCSILLTVLSFLFFFYLQGFISQVKNQVFIKRNKCLLLKCLPSHTFTQNTVACRSDVAQFPASHGCPHFIPRNQSHSSSTTLLTLLSWRCSQEALHFLPETLIPHSYCMAHLFSLYSVLF